MTILISFYSVRYAFIIIKIFRVDRHEPRSCNNFPAYILPNWCRSDDKQTLLVDLRWLWSHFVPTYESVHSISASGRKRNEKCIFWRGLAEPRSESRISHTTRPDCVLRRKGRLNTRRQLWLESAEEFNMPLAYLADPWQKMKVHEESEVIVCSGKLAVKFEFSISILSGVEAHYTGKSNMVPFPLSNRLRTKKWLTKIKTE